MLYRAIFLDGNFLPEYTEQRLLVGWHVLAKYWFPQVLLRLEYVLQAWVLELRLARVQTGGLVCRRGSALLIHI